MTCNNCTPRIIRALKEIIETTKDGSEVFLHSIFTNPISNPPSATCCNFPSTPLS